MGDNENNLNVFKKDTSETDYYLGLIANPQKHLIDEPNSSSSLELSETEKDDGNLSSSSKPTFEEINLPKFSDGKRTLPEILIKVIYIHLNVKIKKKN